MKSQWFSAPSSPPSAGNSSQRHCRILSRQGCWFWTSPPDFPLLSVGCILVIMDKAHYCCVICKLHNVVISGPGTTAVGHQCEEEWTRDAALRGALLPTCTDCGLLVRKSSSQLHWGVLKPKGEQFAHQMLLDDGIDGIMSRNNIHTLARATMSPDLKASFYAFSFACTWLVI